MIGERLVGFTLETEGGVRHFLVVLEGELRHADEFNAARRPCRKWRIAVNRSGRFDLRTSRLAM